MILPNQKGDPSAETRTKTIIFPIAKESVVVIFTFDRENLMHLVFWWDFP